MTKDIQDQIRQRRQMPLNLLTDDDFCERNLLVRNCLEQARSRRLVRGALGLTIVQAVKFFASALQGLTNLCLDQSEDTQGQRQEAGQAGNLVIVADIERADAERTVFEQVEGVFHNGCVTIMTDRLAERHLFFRQIGDQNPPAQTILLGTDGLMVALYMRDNIAHRGDGLCLTIWTTASAPNHRMLLSSSFW